MNSYETLFTTITTYWGKFSSEYFRDGLFMFNLTQHKFCIFRLMSYLHTACVSVYANTIFKFTTTYKDFA